MIIFSYKKRKIIQSKVDPLQQTLKQKFRVLKAPLKKVHEAKKLFACEICSEKSFKQKSQLKRHVKRVHEELKSHSCQICPKSFKQISDLRRHVELIHNKVKLRKFFKVNDIRTNSQLFSKINKI